MERKLPFSSRDDQEEKSLSNERWENGLTLRKRKINAIISKQRGFDRFKNEGKKDYEIDIEKLEIPKELKTIEYKDIDKFLKDMKTYIKSENIEYNKLALYCIRVQTLSKDGTNNKILFAELLQKFDFISDILNLIQKYMDNKQIIFEGFWILINILFLQKDNTDLVLFLSNQQCIQLYIKILDKKDNDLRHCIYWLIANLLNNNNAGLNSTVLFHLYMSPLFRLYIFKDLENVNSSKLTKPDLNNLMIILTFLSDFINYTFAQLKVKNIKNFIDYNSNVNYESIKENNEYLYNQSMIIFMNFIENPQITLNCVYGLSKLTNNFDDSTFSKFFISGIWRKLVKGQIKVQEEEGLNYVVQIIGNYLFYSQKSDLDPIFIEETTNYFVQLLKTYPNIQNLRRDIFWSASNISSVEDLQFAETLVKFGLIKLALESIHTDNDCVTEEALFFLLGFFDIKNVDIIINYYNDLEYMKNLYLCLNRIYSKCTAGMAYHNEGISEKILKCIGFLFVIGNLFIKENEENKFVIDFEKQSGFELLDTMLSASNFSQKEIEYAEELLQYRK